MRRTDIRSLALLLVLAACGGDPTPMPDASTPEPDAGPAPDREAPTIVEASPDEGSVGVARDTDFTATFSEPVTLGTVTVRAEGELVDADVSLEDIVLSVAPGGAWPAAAEIEIRVADDFADRAGNGLDRAYVFRFTTTDDAAPTIVSTTPGEGAADVPARLSAVRVRFSEPMDQGAGTVTLEGGAGSVDESSAVWSSHEVVYAIEGLANATDYRLVLAGFRDRQGNAADLGALGDDAIDFTTRPDDEAPRVVSSTPAEGQVDVLVEGLAGVIVVTFDEPIDSSVTSAPLTVGDETTTVAITWEDEDRTARFDVLGVTAVDADHSLDLSGLRDVAGNALETELYLGDGALDFVTGVDRFVPYVAASEPVEGATSVPIPLGSVVLAFSEAMDPAFDQVTVTDDLARVSTIDGTWGSGGTVLTLSGDAFTPGRTFQVDVTALRDLSGTAASDAHAYLGDGRLDFGLAAPTGESCEVPLLIEHAGRVEAGQAWFEVTNEQRTRNNGSGVCDPNGIADTDAVILYRKTTPALGDPSGDGRALRILTDSVSNRVNVDVLAGICDPRDASVASARQVCMSGHDTVDQLLDLPAGDYYVWVSTADGSALDIDIGFEEVAAIPEGERCEDPYDTSSAGYVAPGGPGEPHVWDLPAGPNNSLDISRTNAPFSAISCREEHFGDVVIEYEKVAADTVLDIQMLAPTRGFAAELIHGACRPAEGGVSAACDDFVGTTATQRMSATAPAGPVYLWMGNTSSGSPFGGAHVEIRELPPPTVLGSSCATAIPITPSASVDVTADHAERYFGPSCVPVTSNVTWYRFDTVEALTQARTLGVGAVGLVDADSGAETGCLTNATSTPLARFAPIGTSLCVAVESSSGVTGLAIDSIPYDGPGVQAPVRLDIAPPNFEGTLQEGFSIGGDTWLAVTPTRLYQNMGTAGVISASRAGSTTATINLDPDGGVLGAAAWAIGESLYSLQKTSSRSRFYRLTNTSGVWQTVEMDPGADYLEHTYGLTYDGADFFTIVRESTSSTTRDFPIYRLSDSAPAAPEVIGRYDTIYLTTGLAADAEHFYLFGATSSAAGTQGIFRIDRAALSPDAVTTPTRVATIALGTSTAGNVHLRLYTSPTETYLYASGGGEIHVFADPAGTLRYLGVIFDRDSADYAYDIDPATGSLFAFGMHEDPEGDWYRLDP